MIEKRICRRVPVSFFLKYLSNGICDCHAKVGVEGRQAAIINIGEGGVGILTDTPIPEETKLDLEFYLETEKKSPELISAVGQVCYNIPLVDKDHYHTGVEFIMIKEKDRKSIASFVRARSHGERTI